MFCLHIVPPVIWAFSKIGSCDNANIAGLHLIDDAKGKSADHKTKCILGHRRTCIRELNDSCNYSIQLLGQNSPQIKSRSKLFIVFYSPIKLRFRIIMEIKSHFPHFARISKKTSSPWMSLTSPAPIWICNTPPLLSKRD